jgi:hypothetical protein
MTERLIWAINQRRNTAADPENSAAARASVDQRLSASSTAEARQDRSGRGAATTACHLDRGCANRHSPTILGSAQGLLCLVRCGEWQIGLVAEDEALSPPSFRWMKSATMIGSGSIAIPSAPLRLVLATGSIRSTPRAQALEPIQDCLGPASVASSADCRQTERAALLADAQQRRIRYGIADQQRLCSFR